MLFNLVGSLLGCFFFIENLFIVCGVFCLCMLWNLFVNECGVCSIFGDCCDDMDVVENEW